MASVCAQPIQGPKSHVIFESSSSEGGDGPLAIQAYKDAAAQRDPHDDSDKDDDDGEKQSGRVFRSAYVGRGNVQAVRAARHGVLYNSIWRRNSGRQPASAILKQAD